MRWVLAVLALSIVVGVAVMLRRPSSPVYSVPEIQAGLLAHPNAWLGRIVLVHGIPVTQVLVSGRAVRTIVVRGRVVSGAFSGPLCNTWCPWAHLALAPDPPSSTRPLLLAAVPIRGVAAFLRRMPVVALLVPQGQVMRLGVPGTYRVQLRAVTSASCPPPLRICDDAFVLDAATPPYSWPSVRSLVHITAWKQVLP